MRINGILVLLGATLSTVTLAGPEARRYSDHSRREYPRRESSVTKLSPIRYDGYKYGYSPIDRSENIKSWDGEYPSRYGGHHRSSGYDQYTEEKSEGKGQYGYDIEYLEEAITKAFSDRHGYPRREYSDRRGGYYDRNERGGQGSGLGGGHESLQESGHGSGQGGGHDTMQESGHGIMTEPFGSSDLPSIPGRHIESSEQHFVIKGGIGEHITSAERHTRGDGHSEIAGGHIESSGGHGSGGGQKESLGGHGSGGNGGSVGQIETGGGLEQLGAGDAQQVERKQELISALLEELRGRETSRQGDGYRDRHEDRYQDRYESRYSDRYGDHEEYDLLKDRLPYGSEHLALIGGFSNAGRHKSYKGSYDEHEDEYGQKPLEKGLGFFAHKDTSEEHLQLKSYYLKGDSIESYEYNPYRSYRPYGYRRRYEHSSEESKEYYGYKGIYFGSKERTGFIRDFIKSKGSEEKSKSKSKSDDKSKSKSDDKAKGITEEYKSFVKDILKDLEKGLGIKSKSKSDDKGDKSKGDKGKKAEEKGNKNGLFGGDLVNVIKVTFGHEEKKAEKKKSERRRRSATGYARKFYDPLAI